MQDKWGKFREEVDDVLPLSVREISLEPGGWVENYTKEELRKVYLENKIVGKIVMVIVRKGTTTGIIIIGGSSS